MSIFGPRDEDPLLQNDPLAPPTDEGEEENEENPSSGDSSSEDAPSSGASSRPSSSGPRSEGTADGAASLFESTGADAGAAESEVVPESGGTEDEETVQVRYSLEEAMRGRLGRLNELLGEEWELDRVGCRLNEKASSAGGGPKETIVLSFFLRQNR